MRLAIIFLLATFLTACSKTTSTPQIQHTTQPQKVLTNSLPTPSPTADPFFKLTIPYLRTRTYTSQLKNLAAHQDNSSFTSYLTSCDSDGLNINALLTKLKGEKPLQGWPAIVFVHGYIPPNQYRTTEKYIDYVYSLAQSGYVVLKIDLRGHGTSQGLPSGTYYSTDYVIDTLNAYNALQQTDYINPNRIGLWGHSMAGNILLRSIVTQPDIPAIVIWAGAGFTYQDLLDYRISDNSYRPLPSDTPSRQERQQLIATHGNYDQYNLFCQQVAPTKYLSDIQGAIQLHHAVDDDVVNIEYSRNLNRILNNTSVQHDLIEYPTGGHNITNPSFTKAMQNTLNFYKNQLKE